MVFAGLADLAGWDRMTFTDYLIIRQIRARAHVFADQQRQPMQQL